MRWRSALSLLLFVPLIACGSGAGEPGRDIDPARAAGQATRSAPVTHSFAPVSDVVAHAALGRDIARIKGALDTAKQGRPVDWPLVRAVWDRGGASRKSDGSLRTLAGLVADDSTTAYVDAAILGLGPAQGASDKVRAQYVDKGISVLLAAKVRAELASARGKVDRRELAATDGAAHNVDEAWAFYDAEGSGLAATAVKRAADFDREGQVSEPILTALGAAQTAALAGDAAAFDAAAQAVSQGLDLIFYLATYKYLDTEDDPVRAAEGATFFRGIAARVKAADSNAHAAVLQAFASGDGDAGRSALHHPAVLAALDIDDTERVN